MILRTDRICVGILLFGLIFMIPSIGYIKFIDELCGLLWVALILLDCIVNNNWRRYKVLGITIAIFLFYVFYSIYYVHFNTAPYILMDFIIQLKSFVPFFAFFAINPEFTPKEKKLVKVTSIVNSIIISVSFSGGYDLVNLLVGHPAMAGMIIMMSMLFYLYCSIDEKGQLTQKEIAIIFLFLTIGLACTRSKYYGEYVLMLFFMWLYKPGMLRNSKSILVALLCSAAVLAVSWGKIDFYFLSGGAESIDATKIQTFARPVLYATGGLILIDYFPFGSGLASFATYPSSISYSNLYFEYGIDKVFGLSPEMPDFICDAYYPSLAQFGFVGIVLFIIFWIYAYSFLRKGIRHAPALNKYGFIIGSMIIAFILIESIAGTSFTMACGLMLMGLLGKVCANMRSTAEPETPPEATLQEEASPAKLRSIKKI